VISQEQFNDLQEAFIMLFGPALQYLLLVIAIGAVSLIFVILSLALLRRMLKP